MAERTGNGAYCNRLVDTSSMTIQDFGNPWNFFSLLLQDNDTVYTWLRNNQLLADTMICEKCNNRCQLTKRSGKRGGYTFRCKGNKNHEYSMFKYSYFERGHTDCRDVLVFIKTYLEKSSLKLCSTNAGIIYNTSAVKWASYTREIFVDWYARIVISTKIRGEIEIDESLFGRKWKHHRGKNKGVKVWIFGLVERATNTLLLFPVDKRDEGTLCNIIKKHVEAGSRIYSDGWAGYLNLNTMGYQHFSVIHKTTFKQTYKNDTTGEIVTCHTNQIEGAWKHAKDHFKRINGTKADNFESHLCEIMWRCHRRTQGDIYSNFFEDLKVIYHLRGTATYTYRFPIFDTWSRQTGDTCENTVVPESQLELESNESEAVTSSTADEDDVTIIDDTSNLQTTAKRHSSCKKDQQPKDLREVRRSARIQKTLAVSSEDDFESYVPLSRHKPKRTLSNISSGATGGPEDLPTAMLGIASDRDFQPENIQSKLPATKDKPTTGLTYSNKLSCPKGFKPRGQKVNKRATPVNNPYTKDNFVTISSDSD